MKTPTELIAALHAQAAADDAAHLAEQLAREVAS
jgi:hypothetical protein